MTIAIVGGGKMGMSHLAIATQYAGKRNVVLCDPKFSTRFVFWRLGYRTFRDLDAAIRRGGLSGVVVATPTGSHGALAGAALDRKIPCFVEKPLTLDVAKSEALAAKARASGTPAQVGFVLRYVASFLRLRELVAGGELGEVTGYSAAMAGSVISGADSQSWRTVFAKGGGCLNEYGPHLFDLCRFIFGDVASVGAVKKEQVHSREADDRIALDWTHGTGARGDVYIDWCDETKRKSVIEFDVRFAHARVVVDNSSVKITFEDGAPLSEATRAALSAALVPPNVGFYLRGEEFSLQLEAFIGRCFGRSMHVADMPADIAASLEDGAEVDRLIDAIAVKAGLK